MSKLSRRKRAVRQWLLENRAVWVDGVRYVCEVQSKFPHSCAGGLDMHECFYKKNDFSPLSDAEKIYFYDPLNCHMVCQYAHARWADGKRWREHFHSLQVSRYGEEALHRFFENAPLESQWF